MSDKKSWYKERPVRFGNHQARRILNSVQLNENRRIQRDNIYSGHRNIPVDNETEESPSVPCLEVRLQKWKADRDLRKAIEKKKKKPPFKVGIVHHKFFSPPNQLKAKSTPYRGRSPSTRLCVEDESFGDTEQSKTTQPSNIVKKLDFTVILEKNDETQNCEQAMIQKTPSRSGFPAPAAFSPYIVSSRGKNSARKEQQIKMGIRRSSSVSEIPTKDTVMKNLNISIEEEEQTAQYFKFILESTIKNLNEICNKWTKIKEEPDLPEDAQYEINQAIGQTNLLIRKKFERFRGLVLDCETGKGEKLVTCKDLQGFWDMVSMQVDDCQSRFSKLDSLRSNNWIEQEIAVPSKRLTKKKMVGTKPKIVAKSSARSWIVAARKKMTQPEDSSEIDVVADEINEGKEGMKTPIKDGNSRRSTRRSPNTDSQDRTSIPKATPRKTPTSLRKISYFNFDQTPGKEILKKSENSTSFESSAPKSARKVYFRDDVFLGEVPVKNDVDEQLENSLDL